MQKYANSVQDTLGNAISVATVSVYTDSAHTTLATIYSDNGITPTTNPRTTDSLGEFSFYAADGRYYIKVSKSGITTQFLDDVILFDPTASSSAASINTVQSGTAPTYGWATRTVQGKEGDSFSVKDVLSQSGAAVAGDGVTVDSTGIDAAIAYAAANSKTLVFPAGTYLVGSASWVGFAVASKSNWGIRGEKGAQIKVAVAPSQSTDSLVCLLKLTSCNDVRITGIDFNMNSVVTGAIGMDTCQRCDISGNKIRDAAAGTIAAVHSVTGTENNYAGNVISGMGTGGRGLWIGNTQSGQGETRATIRGNHVFSCGATSIGGTLIESVIDGNVCDSNAGSGISLGSANPTYCRDVTIVGNHLSRNTFHGVQADVTGGSTYAPRGIVVTGNTCLLNSGSGIYLANAQGWTIAGNTIKNNNADNVGSGYGINVSDSTEIAISGNYITDDQGTLTQTEAIHVDFSTALATQNVSIVGNVCKNYSFGIRLTPVSTGTASNITISGNVCDGGASGARGITFTSANITSVLVANNVCVNNSTHDIGDGSGTITAGTVFGINNYATGIAGTLPYRFGLKVVTSGTVAPASGTWNQGDQVWFTNAASGGAPGAICTTGGSPGTWKNMANLA